jgi:phage gpG-like protein
MFELTVDLSQFYEYEKKLDTIPVSEIGKLILQSIEQNFDEEGRPTPWAPRKEEGDGHPLLKDTGSLYYSLFYDILRHPDEIDLEFQSGMPYDVFLDKGTEKMPARPFYLIQDEDVTEIEDILARHFT